MRPIFTFLILYSFALSANAQLIISGTVLDKGKINYVEGARVISTGGTLSLTDSLGFYRIAVAQGDSIFFIYNNKPTQKFPVKDIANPDKFDISVLIAVKSKYRALDEVMVFSNTYRQDSVANRDAYKNIFGYKKPGVQTSITPGGGVGMDLDELINIFRFRRNKSLRSFQKRLEEQEQDKYIDWRFNKTLVRRITGLQSPALDSFIVWYRPSYEFVANTSEIAFTQYILNAFYQFKRVTAGGELKKEDHMP